MIEPQLTDIRDRLWLWGHETGSHNDDSGLPRPSRINPAEAAAYMDIPNLIMVRYKGRPPLPLDTFALSLRGLRRVIWSVVGAHGQTSKDEQAHVLDIAFREPNVLGVMLDDFFVDKGSPGKEPATLTVNELRKLRQHLFTGTRQLSLWGVLYDHQLDQRLVPYLDLMDVVSLWAWHPTKLPHLETTLARLETLAPACGKLLGCYMWDYGSKRPIDLRLLQAQCDQGLAWLQEGRIHGMIFLASCLCDLGLEAVEWTRKWIARSGVTNEEP